jgi:CheY-like chemotaxis protein
MGMANSVVLLSSDLMVASAADGIARRLGAQLITAANADEFVQAVGSQHAALAVLDLRTPRLEVAALLPRLREHAPACKIVAFGPHVHEQSLAAAQAAGCDEVFTRGQFERRFESLLAELKAPAE